MKSQPTWYQRVYEGVNPVEFEAGKVLVLFGPRRVGKTKLVDKILDNVDGRVYRGTGDDFDLRTLISSQKLQQYRMAFSGYDYIFIDEAQRIPDVGFGLKLLVDNIPNVKVVVTGSSSFDLSHKLGEPLTGRQVVKRLFPLSVMELHQQFGGMQVLPMLEQLLIFGGYPEVLKKDLKEDKIKYLLSLRDSYLLRDILELEQIKYTSKLIDLLRLLAYQIGHEVSLNELSNKLGIAKQSVERYLLILENAFVIKKVSGFSRNLRTEIVKTARYYFWDIGIRNALINNFNNLDIRNDIGMLWENFCFIERIKQQEYTGQRSNNYFWRTYSRSEVDFVVERDGQLHGFEFKWKNKKSKAPRLWSETYPEATFDVIHNENFLEYLI